MTSSWSLLFIVILVGLNGLIFWFWGRSVVYERPVAWGYNQPINWEVTENSAARSGITSEKITNTGGTINQFSSLWSAVLGARDPLTNVIFLGDGFKRYKAMKGDTFAALATRFNTSVEAIKSANPGLRTIKPGGVLIIPE